jgi:hypothetical protein
MQPQLRQGAVVSMWRCMVRSTVSVTPCDSRELEGVHVSGLGAQVAAELLVQLD